MEAMLSAENMRRPSSCQCSSCSSSTASTKLVIPASLGMMPTTPGAALYFFMHPLQLVRATDLFSVLRREVTDGQHFLFGFVHWLSSFWDAFHQ